MSNPFAPELERLKEKEAARKAQLAKRGEVKTPFVHPVCHKRAIGDVSIQVVELPFQSGKMRWQWHVPVDSPLEDLVVRHAQYACDSIDDAIVQARVRYRAIFAPAIAAIAAVEKWRESRQLKGRLTITAKGGGWYRVGNSRESSAPFHPVGAMTGTYRSLDGRKRLWSVLVKDGKIMDNPFPYRDPDDDLMATVPVEWMRLDYETRYQVDKLIAEFQAIKEPKTIDKVRFIYAIHNAISPPEKVIENGTFVGWEKKFSLQDAKSIVTGDKATHPALDFLSYLWE